MEASSNAAVLEKTGWRFSLPKSLLDTFVANPRIVLKNSPIGLWPIDINSFQNIEFVKKLAADKDFIKNFEIIIMPKL